MKEGVPLIPLHSCGVFHVKRNQGSPGTPGALVAVEATKVAADELIYTHPSSEARSTWFDSRPQLLYFFLFRYHPI